ncbi:SDR family NAD(P)-dependent oxidoreductase, partial [Streptomyces sp. NPDC002530]
LPRSLHVGTPSTHVDWTAGAVELLSEPRAWPRSERTRRAGISSFGVSGTNAHVIIEEAPEPAGAPDPVADLTLPLVPWLVSSKSASGLTGQTRRLASGTEGLNAADVALSLATTRAALEHRAVVLGTDTDELRARLGEPLAPVVARDGLTGFVFSGQGGQRVGMGRELAAAFPVFAQALDEVCDYFDGLREVMFGEAEALKNTGWAQPALFAVEVALYRLVESWGVRPDYLVGHSVGELAAAHVAGVLPLADAALLVSARAGLMRALPSGGAMWAVRATADEITPLLVEGASLAAVNAPGQVVVSGTREAVEAVAARLTNRQGHWLEVSHAFHSALMDPMLAEFKAAANELTYETPRIPIVSTLTGEPVTEFTAAYWADQVRGTVRFADAITRAKDLGVTRFLELGPDASLVGAIGETDEDAFVVAALSRKQPEPTTAVTTLARLWADGAEVDWAAFYAPTGARVVDLPTYAFQHQRYWPDVRRGASAAAPAADTAFWDAVERGDDELFAAEFGVDAGAPLRDTLPAFAAWQRRRREREAADRLRYEVSWTPLQPSGADRPRGWLLVERADAEDVWADALAEELTAGGAQVARLRLGSDELERAALAARLGEFAGQERVVSFLGQDEAGSAGVAASALLTQALGDAGVDRPVWWVTSGAVAAGPGDVVAHPVRAGVWGLGRVVALEEPGRWGGLVDVPESVSRDSVGRLAEVLSGGYGDEDEVAVRGGAVLGRRLAPAVARSGEESWSPSGTVLVSGGTGALGARVARWAVERGAEHMVLISRRGLDADGAPELREELTGLGAEVDVVACDVAIREDVEALFARFDISAVVHTAGVLDDGVVDGLTPERVAGVWGAKAQGAWNLHHASLARELDAFVLFSSAAGVWGGAGQGAYAAA